MDRTRNKFLACPGFARDQNGGVCGSNLRHKREYFLQGARTPDDLVAYRSLIDFFGQGDALLFESLFRLLWIRHDYRDASHNLPHRSRNVARLLDPFVHVAHSGAGPVWGQPQTESPWTPYRNRRNALLQGVGTNSKVVGDLILSIWSCGSVGRRRHEPPREEVAAQQPFSEKACSSIRGQFLDPLSRDCLRAGECSSKKDWMRPDAR